MAKVHEIKAESRKDEGKGASRRLRRASYVPGVVYGAGKPAENVQVEHNTILLAAKNEWFFSSLLDLSIDGKVQKVLLRDWQKHPYKQQMMHVDFLRIDESVKLRVNVPLHFLNKEVSPAAKTAGVVITHNLNEVEVYCLPKDLPEHIEVDLKDLKLGDIVHLSQLKLPADVQLVQLHLGEAHDAAVVTAVMAKIEVEEEPAPAAEGDAAAAAAAPAAAGKDAAAPTKGAAAPAKDAAPAKGKK
ncbi:MAG: 50S ribosomal protein L25/general stress protein Ctc [Rhodanobacter sp.]|nr:MAG: 50S ribosomal protein L25/general stress protein Ctc [Rhodanobacter sp.]TAM08175.1 MAG: 50S ribosomal protein L25/general stress protein Ctc [Rhodanobacter sp.]TAM36037.1 MAG: 50S ribosomal protein L25/general stress protein Ctc [Rhodanobacter sp.]